MLNLNEKHIDKWLCAPTSEYLLLKKKNTEPCLLPFYRIMMNKLAAVHLFLKMTNTV
jgi:hypothetical protein